MLLRGSVIVSGWPWGLTVIVVVLFRALVMVVRFHQEKTPGTFSILPYSMRC